MALSADTIAATMPCCPRCGYDQSGAVATWTDSCPTHGICPECGFEFAWVDAMFPRRKLSAWLYEHTPGRRPGIGRYVRTIVFSWWPWRFWRSVTLEHPMSIARLGIYAAAAVIIGHLGALLVDFASDWLQGNSSVFTFMLEALALGELPTLLRYLWARLISYEMYKDIIFAIVVAYVATPLCFVLLPVTMSRARVRLLHVARIAVYSIGLLAGAAIVGRMVIAIRDLNGMGRWTWGSSSPRVEYFWTSTIDWVTERYLEGGRGVATFGSVCLILLGAFWWCALTRYLKLPQPRLTALVLVLLGFLVALVAGFAFSAEGMEWCLRGIW